MTLEYKRFAKAMRLAAWLALAAAITGFATCGMEPPVNVNPNFSYNLAVPDARWPRLNLLSPAENEVYQKYGKPDYFRLWYNKQGDLVSGREAGPIVRARKLRDLRRSWIYEDKKIEVKFRSPAKSEEVPLSDQLQVLCLRGDPQERDPQIRNGILREMWTYFDKGEKYIFMDGRLAEKQLFKGVGKPFSRM